MIQGKSCTLTVAKDGYYYPLPYSEETVRQASKGYALPGVIGIRNREKLVETGKAITGCVVTTRLEYNNILYIQEDSYSTYPSSKEINFTDSSLHKISESHSRKLCS